VLIVMTLIVIGPLVRFNRVSGLEVDVSANAAPRSKSKFGLSDLPT
jgi:hypothetical protein